MENKKETQGRDENENRLARTYYASWENEGEDIDEAQEYHEQDISSYDHNFDQTQNNLAHKAYKELWNEECPYSIRLEYAGKFRDYGANIQLRGNSITIKMARRWKNISEEIQIGLMQELLIKILRRRGKQSPKTTTSMDLYNSFVRHIHIAIPKNKSDPKLLESFNRVNDRYFLGLVETPNLIWGKLSKRTFGQYNFKNDTITMNPLLSEHDIKYLDYVMFHEMLHKQRKFERRGTKTIYHDSKFKRAEKIFENQETIEKELNNLTRKKRPKENTATQSDENETAITTKTTKRSTISRFFDFF
jgi:hypothetical protein